MPEIFRASVAASLVNRHSRNFNRNLLLPARHEGDLGKKNNLFLNVGDFPAENLEDMNYSKRSLHLEAKPPVFNPVATLSYLLQCF